MTVESTSKTGTAVAILLLIAASLIAFSPVRNFEFLNLDDNLYVYENPFVKDGFTQEGVKIAFTKAHGGHWHPLTWLSHMMDCELFGLNAGAHHIVNVGFHTLNGILVFYLLRLVGISNLLSLCFSLLFLLHPMRIESVAWVSERKDVLSIFFGLLALISYFRFSLSKCILWYGASVATLALSLLAKPTLVSFPLLALLLDFWPLKRLTCFKDIRPRLFEKLPFFLLVCASALLAILAQQEGGGLKSMSGYTLEARISNAFLGYTVYLSKFFWPNSIGIFYPFQILSPGVGLAALLSLLAISALVWQQRSKHPELLFSWLWFLVALLPVIGFVQIGGQAYADRWSYLPHIGLILGLGFYLNKQKKKLLLLPTALWLLCLTGKFYNELPHWKDNRSIYTHTLEASPDNFMAYTNLGSALSSDGELEEAIDNFKRAVQLRPRYPVALNNLGTAQARLGRYEEAKASFEKVLRYHPHYVSARYNLGLLYQKTGKLHEGAIHWILALATDPTNRAAAESLERSLPQLGSYSGQPSATVTLRLDHALSRWEAGVTDRALHKKVRTMLLR